MIPPHVNQLREYRGNDPRLRGIREGLVAVRDGKGRPMDKVFGAIAGELGLSLNTEPKRSSST